jgi:hypothetical protein
MHIKDAQKGTCLPTHSPPSYKRATPPVAFDLFFNSKFKSSIDLEVPMTD